MAGYRCECGKEIHIPEAIEPHLRSKEHFYAPKIRALIEEGATTYSEIGQKLGLSSIEVARIASHISSVLRPKGKRRCECGALLKNTSHLAHKRSAVHVHGLEIKRLVEAECATLDYIAKRVGVSRQRVHQIVRQLGLRTGGQRESHRKVSFSTNEDRLAAVMKMIPAQQRKKMAEPAIESKRPEAYSRGEGWGWYPRQRRIHYWLDIGVRTLCNKWFAPLQEFVQVSPDQIRAAYRLDPFGAMLPRTLCRVCYDYTDLDGMHKLIEDEHGRWRCSCGVGFTSGEYVPEEYRTHRAASRKNQRTAKA